AHPPGPPPPAPAKAAARAAASAAARSAKAAATAAVLILRAPGPFAPTPGPAQPQVHGILRRPFAAVKRNQRRAGRGIDFEVPEGWPLDGPAASCAVGKRRTRVVDA